MRKIFRRRGTFRCGKRTPREAARAPRREKPRGWTAESFPCESPRARPRRFPRPRRALDHRDGRTTEAGRTRIVCQTPPAHTARRSAPAGQSEIHTIFASSVSLSSAEIWGTRGDPATIPTRSVSLFSEKDKPPPAASLAARARSVFQESELPPAV